jgi:hypothetical protein
MTFTPHSQQGGIEQLAAKHYCHLLHESVSCNLMILKEQLKSAMCNETKSCSQPLQGIVASERDTSRYVTLDFVSTNII